MAWVIGGELAGMDLRIEAESSFGFSISVGTSPEHRHWLEQRGGEWRLDGGWVATSRIEWPEALARALRLVTGHGLARRTHKAIRTHAPLKADAQEPVG